MKNLLVVVLVLIMVSSAGATIISADADGHIDGTDISTVFPGMMLSSVGGYPELDGLVHAWRDGLASTPTSVFGNNLSFQRQWSAHITDTQGFALRADFDQLANSVVIDIICDGYSGDIGGLYAYNSAGVLLDSDESHLLGYGDVFTAQINRSSFDIAYIIAGGAVSTGYAVHLDNLTANVPEPATLCLLGLGGLLLTRTRRILY